MILVTGATGGVGGAVVRELIGRGVKGVGAMCRSEKDQARLPVGAEAVVADFADPASLVRALRSVTAAYLVCAPIPELVQLETNFLLACRETGLGHVVINSALGAEDFGKTFPSWHRKVEDKARELGLPCTILRPNGFMQNIVAYFAPTIRAQDAFYGTIGDAKISLIDVRDIAAAAAEALMRPATVGQVLELSGPEAVSYDTLAARISAVAGRAIHYVNLSPEQMRQGMVAAGVPAPQAAAVVDLDDYYRAGKGATSDLQLRQLLGRPPRTLESYLAEVAAQFEKVHDAL
jgi:uncharacterized protein YbjT (DUF2867 family)